MIKNYSNRRSFIKASAVTTTGLLLSQNSAAQIVSPPKSKTKVVEENNFSIQTLKLDQYQGSDFNGDNINRPHEILWDVDGYIQKKGGWPLADRSTKIVVVGGGMSGLLASYFLRDQNPILLEQDSKLGGNSKGEVYNKSMYSIGAAYITVPDKGSSIEKLLKELNLFNQPRIEAAVDVVMSLKNQFVKDFWAGVTDPKRAEEFIMVASELKRMFDEQYPDIPWTKESAISFEKWKALDEITFRKWLDAKWPNLHPHILEYFQLYAWSSMNGSIDELSALQILNFLTAETIGVMAFPGGNSLITYQLHKALSQDSCPVESNAFVVQVKTNENGVLVTYENALGELKAIQCEHCIVAAPKFVASKIIPELPADQLRAIEKISYRGYIVANVILKKKIISTAYDIFMLTGTLPETPSALTQSGKGFTDICFGSWAQNDDVEESVLTLYRPLPFDGARQFLFSPAAYEKTKIQMTADLMDFLKQLDLSADDIKGIRLTRWGHSLPVAQAGLLASGTLDLVSRSVKDRIHFANQDNYANPAFETAFAAAELVARKINI